MVIVLDADGLIKLSQAGVLEHVAQAFQCVIPDAVYHEAVTKARERQYRDAEEIERVVKSAMTIQPAATLDMPEFGLGAGETAVLALAAQQEGESTIVSDDRRFLAFLNRQGVPFLMPSALIAMMAQQGFLTMSDAREILERLRPLIREAAFQRALQELEKGEVL